MQGGATAKQQARDGDRGAAKTPTTEGKGDAAGAKASADVAKGDAAVAKAAGDDVVVGKGDAGNKAGAGAMHHGLSAVEANDSQTIVALQSPVTVMRPVRGDLEEHLPKPCESARARHFLSSLRPAGALLHCYLLMTRRPLRRGAQIWREPWWRRTSTTPTAPRPTSTATTT